MAYPFFVSYASEDFTLDNLLPTFLKDLEKELRSKTGLPEGEVRFLDRCSINLGKKWAMELTEALRTSSICVCICSPQYLRSEYCSKEFQIFCQRLEAWRPAPGRSGDTGQAIFPVIWEAMQDFPEQIKQFQYTGKTDKGTLRDLKGNSRQRSLYRTVLRNLAAQLDEAWRTTPLPPMPHLPLLSETRGAWHHDTRVSESRQAHFVYFAGTRDQMRDVRDLVECYGVSGSDWQPFHPDCTVSVKQLSESVVSRLGLSHSEVQIDGGLIERLNRAREVKEPFTVVADPWSMYVEKYQQSMRECDPEKFVNCSVVVVWNPNDPETTAKERYLEEGLYQAIPRLRRPFRTQFGDSVGSAADLTWSLERALSRGRMSIISGSKAIRVESEELEAEAGLD